ncbi:hypothetical protein ARALYDRAFT_911686 [Arabidopsis lyrata subsp. lyrata]|uniref:NIF system FeS cluster assembly NifU N-terminal domain-containing protein n=1 Tax=Arabidopsis lyrata subsp. lyrata TaxID=81972 RepID=D7M159_ARALL|nr:hypothetical protein ARALYDRAFT_911686 [Arabidopsis lyrata subsp. lyrata]
MLRQTTKRTFLGLASRNSTPFPVVSRSYHPNVVDHYDNPRNVGSFDKSDPNVGTGLVGAPQCGDVMKLQVKFDGSGQIIDAKFKTFGCGSAIAASSLLNGSRDNPWKKQIAKHLSLPPVKLLCSMLAEDAIKAAVKNYKQKQAEANSETVEA